MSETPMLVDPSLVDEGIVVTRPVSPRQAQILCPDALRFVARLAREFGRQRRVLLKRRAIRQKEIDAGKMPDFLPETGPIRCTEWKVARIPDDLRDRRVEITGPATRHTVSVALTSGASTFVADFDDTSSPTWDNCVDGQVNLFDAVRGAIAERPVAILVRPRGWHLDEKHLRIGGDPVPAALVDFGLYFFHNAAELIARGSGPYFCLAKLESHLEARLWNDIFNYAQDLLRIPRGTVRATVLIETILAAFEMDEILFELREHGGGLGCGRWDYIFNFIKRFRNHGAFVLPDRAEVTMESGFLRACTELLVHTCHRRGIHAIGGVAPQLPVDSDADANRVALARIRSEKSREVEAGYDGTCVAHPGLVALAREAFDAYTHCPNQIHRVRDDVSVDARDLLDVPRGAITEAGLRTNINVGIRYLEAWLRGEGSVPLHHLMEDAATAEISRSQVWQWIRHEVVLLDGRSVDRDLVMQTLREELDAIRKEIGDDRYRGGRFDVASKLFAEMMTSDEFVEFMPARAYDFLQ